MRDLGLDEAFLRRSETAILRALEGGHCLTRAELAVALREAGLGVQDGMTMAHITLAAELDGLVCSGPRRGTQQTYALLDERVPAAPTLTIDEALAELIWRYFSSHGPALVQDCAWWSGLPIGQVRRGLELNATRLSPETVDGRTYWFRPAARPRTPEKVYLLPNFDEYTVAYRERDLYYDRVLNWTGNPRNDVPFRNVIVVNGRVVGHWSRTLHQQKLTIYTHWAIEASEAEVRELDAATQRYGAFLQPCVL
jgi:hypothetical protein